MSGTRLKVDGLDKLIKMLGTKNRPFVRVGILGVNATAVHVPEDGTPTGITTAEIGAIHEFGGPKTVIRSWLRMPLSTRLNGALEASGMLKGATFREVMKTGDIEPWLVNMGIVAESVIGEAFDTGGFGEWKPSQMDRKKNEQTLVETQQLRNAVTSEVKNNG